MGCFATCFGTSRRSRRPPSKTSPRLRRKLEILEALQVKELPELLEVKNPTNLLPELKAKERGQQNISGRKKVTFDLNLKIYERLSAEKGTSDLEEYHEEREELSTERVTVELEEFHEKRDDEQNEETARDRHCQSCSSSSSSLTINPPNYRYQNCRDSDDEYDEVFIDYSYMDDDIEDDDGDCESEINNDQILVEGESSESPFSLSMGYKKQTFTIDTADKEVNSSISSDTEIKKIGSNQNEPVEDLTQFTAVKARAKLASVSHAKENVNLKQDFNTHITKEPSSKPSMHCQKLKSAYSKNSDHDIAVDASLSNWLVEVKTCSISAGNSSSSQGTTSLDDRPILGALTVEEIKQFSAFSTPRRSPSRSPDDMPIIGTVGGYWSHTVSTSISDSGSSNKKVSSIRCKSREDKKMNWKSSLYI
ncbi:hypothetical protein Nepgr_001409 [Nepenthes gracilis]|uniref:Uncharacterized protein n=1 Tax=Nepenthes gracilis TaxID=150966 RepID=A0AAD3RXQ5_NEPGR|nr:hypothetical protein Nepgr_001409 [Nepenthes gracilis]